MQEARDVEENQPRCSGNLIEPDGRKDKTEADRQDCLGYVIPAKPYEGCKGEQHKREDLGRSETQCDRCQHGRKCREQDNGNRATDERGECRGNQRKAGTAL